MPDPKPYDMKEVIDKIVDDREFFELQPDFAANIITGMARMDGSTVGIVASQPMEQRAVWISTPAARRPVSSGSATPSTSRW